VVDRHPSNEQIFKGWSEVTCIQPKGTVTPLHMYVMEIPKGDQDQVIRYTTERHSLQFQGTVNTLPCRILLDTGATGTAIIDRQHCVKEGIVLGPAPAHQIIVMADGSKTKCTNMATIKIR
jgi:predicted aspartyl protease